MQLKRSLEADGILNGAGHAKWNESNIKQIITNEKYIGDALLQKTYTVDILEKKREANIGQVPKNIFLKVQEEIARRANLTKGTTQRKRIYSGRYALSGIVFCHIVETSTAESNRIIEAASLRFGAVLVELKRTVPTAQQEQFMRNSFTKWW